jgi:macrolide transport system ATP-binding/permease protein
MSLLKLSKIQLNYQLGEQTLSVLKQVNLQIDRGEMVAILGPSGSGKSTLLYILGCLLKPSSGSYELAGHEVTELESEQLAELRSREIGFVFQQFHLLPRANLIDNVLLASRYNHGETRSPQELEKRATQVLTRVGLKTHLDHKPNQLSGGQQQRVAIARALMNDPALILADEPTGNLDSHSANQVLDILQEIHAAGGTVLIITHDPEVAKRCQRVVTIKDGVLQDSWVDRGSLKTEAEFQERKVKDLALNSPLRLSLLQMWSRYGQTAWQNLMRNKARSFLTMLGVSIGIAAVLSTITLGSFTRAKILDSYETLGINKLIVRAYPRGNVKATELKGPKFDGVNQETDIGPIRRLFHEIRLISPVVQDYIKSVEYGGRSDDRVRLLGVSPEYFQITARDVVMGTAFSDFHWKNHSSVCVIGHEIATQLFSQESPLHKILLINGDSDKQYPCFIIGVLAAQASNSEWNKPDQQILLPESYLSIMAGKWYSKPYEFDMQIQAGSSVEDLGTKIKQFFFQRYGRSAQVAVDSDQLLVAQMRKFLNLFGMLLAGVAFISLAVGGIGITNMMLVSVAERFKEIGLRKALGARDTEIRMQFLVESFILCALAGLTGVVVGVVGYHTVLFFASKVYAKIQFEWLFNFPAIVFSVICIFVVGVASGIVPALRAQKLEVVEALRSE